MIFEPRTSQRFIHGSWKKRLMTEIKDDMIADYSNIKSSIYRLILNKVSKFFDTIIKLSLARKQSFIFYIYIYE